MPSFTVENPSQMTNTSAYIDLSNFRQQTGGDPQFVREVLELIEAQSPLALQQMQDHLAQQDLPALGAAAHKLKSTIHVLGNPSWVEMLKTIEYRAKEASDPQGLDTLLREWEAAYANMMRCIAAELVHLRQETA